jgi:hypothetical protein
MGQMSAELIAPCGMNCRLCSGYIRKKNPCPGCRGEDSLKPRYCVGCKIVNCEIRTEAFCHCEKPCRRLKELDKRYSTKYRMSMLENLRLIRERGIEAFVKREEERWACPNCGEILSCHRKECPHCGEAW